MFLIRYDSHIYYKEIGKHTERITKIKPFINKDNLEGIHFPWGKSDWKRLRKKSNYLS